MWHYSSTFAKTQKPTLVHYYIPDFIWMSPVSPLMSFTCSRIPSRVPCCIQLLCLLSFFCSGTVFQSFLIFHNLDSFVEYWSGILQNVPPFAFIWCFLMIKFRVTDLGEEHLMGEVPFSSHHITRHTSSTGLIAGDVNLDHLVKVGLPDFSIKLLFFSFPYFILWQWVTKSSPHSSFTSWSGEYLLILFGILHWGKLVSSIYLFIQSFILYQCGLIHIYFIFGLWSNTILFPLLFTLFQVLLLVAPLGWLLGPFDMPSSFIFLARPCFLALQMVQAHLVFSLLESPTS